MTTTDADANHLSNLILLLSTTICVFPHTKEVIQVFGSHFDLMCHLLEKQTLYNLAAYFRKFTFQ